MTPETHQPCMRKYVTCDADESADNWCEACRPRLAGLRQPTRREVEALRLSESPGTERAAARMYGWNGAINAVLKLFDRDEARVDPIPPQEKED